MGRDREIVAGLAPVLLSAATAFAAPDELALGKDQGYPICAASPQVPMHCLIGLVSRRDEISPARKVPRGETVHELRRAAGEPDITYRFQGESGGIDHYLARNRTTGLLLLHGDTILVERYQYDRTPRHRMTSMSMAKTVVAMLVGIAVQERAIASIHDPARKYVEALRGTPYGETRIVDLLRMSSGMRFTEVYSGADDVALLARLSIFGESDGGVATLAPFKTRARPPGEGFQYASGDTQVLGLVLRHATGKTLSEYLSEKIWKPMGAEADASWLIDKGGYEAAFSGLNATLRDYARFGMLLANSGAVDGRQLIPADWVRAATQPSSDRFAPGRMANLAGSGVSMFGYGYQTWLLPGKERQFALRGIRGQAIFVDPSKKLVMVHTGAMGIGSGYGELMALWYKASGG